MKNLITAAELIEIIAANGGETVSIDGGHPEVFATADDLELDGTEVFEVIENYGWATQFHLVSDKMRAVVTTGLKGQNAI